MSYYDRKVVSFIDGSPIFHTKEDEMNEKIVADAIEKSWSCECRSLGRLAAIDWTFIRDERLVGIGELKSKAYESTKFKTAYLNVRKWLALLLASSGLGVPAIFVVKFTDKIVWLPINEINTKNIEIGGCKQIVKSRNDIEPIIHVPVNSMKLLNNLICASSDEMDTSR